MSKEHTIRNAALLGAAALIMASLAARWVSFPVETTDYTAFLRQWSETLRNAPGLTAFRSVFSDYAPLYLYLLKLLTFLPLPALYSIKTLSVVFDAVIAALAYLMIKRSGATHFPFLAFAAMFAVPTLVINSSLWGQSDALYAAAVVAALYFMIEGRGLAAALSFGAAFSLKLQAAFFLPVLAGYLLGRRRLKYLLLIPLAYILSVLPAWLSGGSLSSLLLVYLRQTEEYPFLSFNAPSVFAFAGDASFAALPVLGIILALCAAVALTLLSARAEQRNLLFLSLVSVTLLPFLLPYMHERYFYLADVLAMLYFLHNRKRWYIPLAVVGASLLSYLPYLSQTMPALRDYVVDLRLPAALMLLALVAMAHRLGVQYWNGKGARLGNARV